MEFMLADNGKAPLERQLLVSVGVAEARRIFAAIDVLARGSGLLPMTPEGDTQITGPIREYLEQMAVLYPDATDSGGDTCPNLILELEPTTFDFLKNAINTAADLGLDSTIRLTQAGPVTIIDN